MKYSLVGAAIIASTVMTAAAPVDDKGILGPRSAAYAGLSQPSEEQGSLRRREDSAYFGGQERGRLATRTDKYPDKHPDKHPGKGSKSRSRSRSKSRSLSKGKGKDYEHPGKEDEHPGKDNEHPGKDNEHPGKDNEHPGKDDEHPGKDDEHPGKDGHDDDD